MRKDLKRFGKALWQSKKPGWRALRLVLLFICLGMVTVLFMENSLIYFPAKYPEGDWDTKPFQRGEGGYISVVREIDFTADDGTALHGWLCLPHTREADGSLAPFETDWLILCCHGNAGNLSHRREKISLLQQLPAAVFIFDYRGYGKSSGKPHEEGLYSDTLAAWEEALRQGFRADRIVIHGTSLGAAPAIDLCTRVNPAGLITEAAFTSIPDVAGKVYPIIPSFLIRTDFNNLAKIPQVQCPKLFIHGADDQIIPMSMTEQLYAAAAAPKDLYLIPGGDHNSAFLIGEEYLDQIRQLMARIESPEPDISP